MPEFNVVAECDYCDEVQMCLCKYERGMLAGAICRECYYPFPLENKREGVVARFTTAIRTFREDVVEGYQEAMEDIRKDYPEVTTFRSALVVAAKDGWKKGLNS